jgi:hypothetical protein
MKERFNPERQPSGDPDCKLGVKESHNQGHSTALDRETRSSDSGKKTEEKEYLWGYGSGVSVARHKRYGEFVLSEHTFILVFRELGDRGLGRGRGKYHLQEVEAVHPLSGDRERIYSATDEMVCHSQLEVGFQDIERRAEEIPGDTVILRFLTPTRIKHQGSFISQPPFHVIVRNVLRRVSSLYYFHCGEPWKFAYRGTIERAKEIRSAELDTRWVDWERYSGRQKTRLKMGGFVGEAVYEGDLTEFRPLLLLGQLVHIGKARVFGNGRYEIR